jgi:hypothetical protein
VSKRWRLLDPDGSDRVRSGGRPDDYPTDGSTDDSSYWPAHHSADNRSCHRTTRRASVVRHAGG